MKKLLLFLLWPLFLSAQDYQPVITDGAFWDVGAYSQDNTFDCLTDLTRYYIDEEITINDQEYKQLRYHFIINEQGNNDPCPENSLVTQSDYVVDNVYIREDIVEKKVYLWSDLISGTYQEYLLYDFSLNIGDQMINPYNYGGDIFIADIQIDDEGKRTFFTNNGYEYTEGIGGISGLIAPLESQFEYYSELYCHGDNDQQNGCLGVLATNSFVLNNVSLYPNPVKNQLTIQSEIPLKVTISNALGKEVRSYDTINNSNIDLSKLSQGIYFVKVVNVESKSEKTFKIVKK